MTRYLRPDLLRQAGIERFDDWAATFGNVVTKNQQTADGRLKLKTKFANFTNLPELMNMYKEFSDIQSAEKLNLPCPKLKTGKPQIIKVEATPEQSAYVKELAERAKACEDGTVTPDIDNHLKITSEARLVGLGNEAIRSLYQKQGRDFPEELLEEKSSKVDKCIENVVKLYKQTEETKGVQIIFSDIAVNDDKGNFSVYNYIKNELTEKYNIPENEIVFAPKSDSNNRENIFRDINNSKYRVIIASTGTLGTGANIQQNLYALHHLDTPWKPSDFQQREGRILRQGNKNKEVEIFNYVTEGTLDSYLYQTVTDKARFVAQLLDNKAPARVSEDCDEKVLTFGEIQAAAEGNPDFKRRIELSNEVAELTMLRNEYNHETAITKEKAIQLPEKIEKAKINLAAIKKDKETAEKIFINDSISFITASGIKLEGSKEINSYLHNMISNKKNNFNENTSATISSFKVSAEISTSAQPSFLNTENEMIFKIEGARTYTTPAGTSESQNNYVRLKNFFENVIPKQIEFTEKRINDLETSLIQANQRISTPFNQENELENKIHELKELEAKLSGLSESVDDIIDADEEPIVETAQEKSEREKNYNTDSDDYQPLNNDYNADTPYRR